MRTSARLVAAVALLSTGFGLAGPGTVRAAPGDCNLGTLTDPVGLPFGTSFYAHNDFAGTNNSSGPTTIAYTDSANNTTQVLGAAGPACQLNALAFNSTDGYLYALNASEVVGDSPTEATLVKIGRDPLGAMAMEEVGTVAAPGGAPGAANVLSPVAGAMSAPGTLTIPGQYLDPLDPFSPNNFTPWLLNYAPDGSLASAVQQTFAPDCVDFIRNLVGQTTLYIRSQLYNAFVGPQAPQWSQVEPEGGVQDWAYSPVDGMLYGYASVDARDSDYPRGGGPVPGASQTYLGVEVTIPAYNWLPPGVAGTPYTISRQPDWLVQVDPVSGTTHCAAVPDPARGASGAIHLPADPTHPTSSDPRDVSAADPVYPDPNDLTIISAGGGSEIGGSTFTTDGLMQLFENEQSRHWTFDPASCTFTNTPLPGTCTAPVLTADVLPDQRQRADAASAIFPVVVPITIVKQTVAQSAPATFGFEISTDGGAVVTHLDVAGGSQATTQLLTSNGVVQVDEAGLDGWTAVSADCNGSGTNTAVVVPGVAVICTFVNEQTPAPPTTSTTTAPATSVDSSTSTTGPVTVAPPTMPSSSVVAPNQPPSLPATGRSVGPMIAVALALLAVGGGAVVARRTGRTRP
jgi:uncharacterized protein DUF6923